MRAALLAAALAAAGAAQAEGERVIAALSQNRVSLTTTWSGQEIFVFGAVKREAPEAAAKVDVIAAVDGPAEPVTVRRKSRVAGIWTNTDSVLIDSAPSFYAVASTGPLSEILSETDDLRHRIGIDKQVRLVGAPADVAEAESFREAVIRLRRADGLYVEKPGEVRMTENTLFTASIALPANLVEGDYRARVFLLHDREVIDSFETSIAVRKEGLERIIFALSRENPAVYGLLSILLALVAGWGASEAFRLLRR